jgi:glycosyltransferase involved in cell wall biosynthesis
MKVCFVTPNFTIGFGYPPTFFISKLAKKHEIIIITSNKQIGADGRNMNLRIVRLNSFILKFKYVMPELIQKLTNVDTDIFHLYGYRTLVSWVGTIVGKIRNIPTVLTMDWNSDTGIVRHGLKYFIDAFLNVPVIKNSSVITVYTQDQKEMLINFGIDEKKIMIIPNGIEYEKYDKIKRTKEVKVKLGLDPRNKIILTASRISPEKNLEFLIKAFSHIRKRNKNVSLLIVGPKVSLTGRPTTDYYNKLEALVKRLKLSNDVSFYGTVRHENIHLVYSAADIFAFSSLSESSGNVLLEAIASGLPIISTPVGIAPELVKKGCGFLANDLSSFSEALELLVNDNVLRRSMGRHAKKVAKEYSWSRMVSRYDKAYEKALLSIR